MKVEPAGGGVVKGAAPAAHPTQSCKRMDADEPRGVKEKAELDAQIAKTVSALKEVITVKKPKLSEKYFQRPPLRFIHECIMAVSISTGFGKELLEDRPELETYTKEMKQSKELRMDFFTRWFYFLDHHMGKEDVGKFYKFKAIIAGRDAMHIAIVLETFAKEAKIHTPESSQAAIKKTIGFSNPHLLPDLEGVSEEYEFESILSGNTKSVMSKASTKLTAKSAFSAGSKTTKTSKSSKKKVPSRPEEPASAANAKVSKGRKEAAQESCDGGAEPTVVQAVAPESALTTTADNKPNFHAVASFIDDDFRERLLKKQESNDAGDDDDSYDSYADDWHHEPEEDHQALEDGSVYKGHVDPDGARNGEGTMTFSLENPDELRAEYTGRWRNGKQEGRGKLLWKNGDVYVGNFSGNQMHGEGELSCCDGASYKGRWKDGYRHGKGVDKLPNGDIYDGSWKTGKYHGSGKKVWRSGVYTYEGQWKKGNMHGVGTYRFAGGNTHGFFEEGKLHGRHVATFDAEPKNIYEATYDMTDLRRCKVKPDDYKPKLAPVPGMGRVDDQPESNEELDEAVDTVREDYATTKEGIIKQLKGELEELGLRRPAPSKLGKYFSKGVPFKAFIDVFNGICDVTGFASGLFKDRADLVTHKCEDKEEFFTRVTVCCDAFQRRRQKLWDVQDLIKSGMSTATEAGIFNAIKLLLCVTRAGEECKGGRNEQRNKDAWEKASNRSWLEARPEEDEDTEEEVDDDLLPETRGEILEQLTQIAERIGITEPAPSKFEKYFGSFVPFRAFLDTFLAFHDATGFGFGLFDDCPELLDKKCEDKGEFFMRISVCADVFMDREPLMWNYRDLGNCGVTGNPGALSALELLLLVAIASDECLLKAGGEGQKRSDEAVQKAVDRTWIDQKGRTKLKRKEKKMMKSTNQEIGEAGNEVVKTKIRRNMPNGGEVVVTDKATGSKHRIPVPPGAKKGDRCSIEVPIMTKTLPVDLPVSMPAGGAVRITDRNTGRTVRVLIPRGAKTGDELHIEIPVPPPTGMS